MGDANVVVAVVCAGGLLYGYWRPLDIAARQGRIKDAIGFSLESVGLAVNVASEVVPNALFVPILHGIPTVLALAEIHNSPRGNGKTRGTFNV